MAALTDNRLTQQLATPYRGMTHVLAAQAAVKYFAGSIGCRDAAGAAAKGAVSTTLRALGRVKYLADNSGGGAGAITVEIEEGCFEFANSSAGDLITVAHVGNQCFMVDDQTVALTNGGSTRSVAGRIAKVTATGVFVEMGIHIN